MTPIIKSRYGLLINGEEVVGDGLLEIIVTCVHKKLEFVPELNDARVEGAVELLADFEGRSAEQLGSIFELQVADVLANVALSEDKDDFKSTLNEFQANFLVVEWQVVNHEREAVNQLGPKVFA